jgi:hypothetical protein
MVGEGSAYQRIGFGGSRTVLTIAMRIASTTREKKLPMKSARRT